jgi:DNA-binding cell septation regulator SpoVG
MDNLTDLRKALRGSQTNPMITVERITRIDTAGSLQGFASVDVGGALRIHDLRIIHQDGQSPWVSMPQASYEQDGRRKWYSIIEMPDNVKVAIQDAVLKAWRADP